MKYIIELLTRPGDENTRQDSFLAICSHEGELLSKAGVGAGINERAAIQEAVNSYFKRREDAEAAAERTVAHEPTRTLPPYIFEGLGLPPHPVATDPAAIKRMAQLAIDTFKLLRMEYVDAFGAKSNRIVKPLAVRDAEPSAMDARKRSDRIEAINDSDGAFRSFRVDRIKRLELVA